jgi:Zn-dependent M28 family amino/carboxypeptidase
MITLWTEDAEKVFPWAAIRGFLTTRPGMTWLDGPGRLPAESPGLAGSATLHAARAAELFRGAKVSWVDAMAAARESRPGSVDLPVRVRIERRTARRELEAPNVIGRIPGADPALRDEYVVFTAHLDHDGIGPPVDGDSTYNGAVDNASGVAALLAIAQAFAEGPAPRRSLLFVATAAEEAGLLGAAYFAAHPVVPIDAIVANLNMDGNHMLFPTKSIVALGGQHSTLGAVARQATDAAGLALETDLMPEQAFFIRSDQYPFVRKGVPALFFVNGLQSADSAVNGPAVLGKWLTTVYHTPKDDLQQPMHWDAGAQYARVVYRIGRLVADDPARPQWNEGDFFGETFGAERAAAR